MNYHDLPKRRFRSPDKKNILQNISLELSAGAITAIVGPNGSGKSTLLKLMAGVIKPDLGQIRLNQRELNAWPKKQLARTLAYLPQSSERPQGMTVEEVVNCGRFAHLSPWAKMQPDDHRAVQSALMDVGMLAAAKQPVDHLSGGEMQRVWLATILAQGSDLLLLDEPNSFLDLSHQLELMALIQGLNRRLNKTIVLVIHDLNQAIQWCDRVLIMYQGQLFKHGDISLLQDPATLQQVFDLSVRFIRLPDTCKPLLYPSALTRTAELEQ